MGDLYTFPPAPDPDAVEWAGTPIGADNVITRTRTRTALYDKAIDAEPGRREALVASALAHIRRAAGRGDLYVHDVVIHGVRVRATTNSPHLHDFWVDNWYSPEEWRAVTGLQPPSDPQVVVYALSGVPDQEEAAYYSRATSTIVFFNTAYYGQLKSWVLGAVGRVLAADVGIHSIHGACVVRDGRGVLYIAPTGTGKSTSSYGLTGFPGTRFHSDDWVYVRYTYRTRDGRRVHPTRITVPGGERVEGYRVFRWVEERALRDAEVTGIDLEHREVRVRAAELDRDAPVEAYAFTSEKVFYLRTNLVENFPLAAGEMLRSRMENVPDVGDAFLRGAAPLLGDLVAAIRNGATGGSLGDLAQMPEEALRRLLARMIAFDNARAMLNVGRVLPAHRIFINPMEPALLAAVVLLKRDARDPTVVEHLTLPRFVARLLIGETPERKREIAYNAYRAVDDTREQAYVRALEAEAAASGADGPEALYRVFAARRDVPETLAEEFELFRVLHQACHCYDMNTILTADPAVPDKAAAVGLTMRLIARILDDLPEDVRYTLETYRAVIAAGRGAPR